VRARLVATGMAGGAAPPAGVAAAAAGAGAGAGGGRTSEEGCVTPRKGGGGRAGPVRKNEGQAEQTKERQQTHTAHTQKTKRSADVGWCSRARELHTYHLAVHSLYHWTPACELALLIGKSRSFALVQRFLCTMHTDTHGQPSALGMPTLQHTPPRPLPSPKALDAMPATAAPRTNALHDVHGDRQTARLRRAVSSAANRADMVMTVGVFI